VSVKIKASLEARKNRLYRRLIGALGESLSALALLCAAAFFSALFIFACNCLLSASYFEIKQIAVRGVKELTEKDILEMAHIKPHSNILAVNTDAVASRITANPWVKHIYIGRELPDRLVLDVRERKPVALIKEGGSFYLIDGDGFVFKRLSKGDEVDLAIITGVKIQPNMKTALFAEALKLLETLAASDQHGFLGTVSEVHVDDVFGLSILTDQGLHLKLGRENFAGKLNQLKIVLADLEKRGMKNGHLFVDLADISKVTVQREDALGKAQEQKKGPQYRI